MLFDYLNNILYDKEKELLEENNEFVPFLIQRWLSMHSPEVAYIVNETTNRYWAAMGDKQDWYNMLMTQLPRVKFKKLQYIKKPKETNNKDDDLIKRLADNMEISQREVRLLLEKQSIDKKMFNVDIYKK
jgi:hypothetical protein